MLNRSQKEALVVELADAIRTSTSITFINYRALTSPAMTALKKSARDAQCMVKVVRKTLLERACRAANVAADIKPLDGQVAVVLSFGEATDGPRIMTTFAKNNDAVAILAGWCDGQFLTAAQVTALANLPSKDQLRGQLVGTLAAPLSGLLRVFSGTTRSMLTVLTAIGEAKGKTA